MPKKSGITGNPGSGSQHGPAPEGTSAPGSLPPYPNTMGSRLFRATYRTTNSLSRTLELLGVLHGLKPVIRQELQPAELKKTEFFCRKHALFLQRSELSVLDLNRTSALSNEGLLLHGRHPDAKAIIYISRDKAAAIRAARFEAAGDHGRLGLSLGYPRCCIDFYIQNRPKRVNIDDDYVLPALRNSRGKTFPFLTNLCAREIGISLLSHFPCDFNCKASIKAARRTLELLERENDILAAFYAERLKGKFKIGPVTVTFI